MKIAIISILLISLSGCWSGGVKYSTPPPPANPPPVEHKPIEFQIIDSNKDGTITKEEAETYNTIIKDIEDNQGTGAGVVVKYFLLLMGLMTLACCGPWIYRKVKSKWVK